MQTIDENAISELSLATELANFINNTKESEKIGSRSNPRFLWVLRDFVLEMKENGRDITENEYLESRLSNFAKSNS